MDHLINIFPEDSMCPVLNIRMEFGGGWSSARRNSPSLDRIDPSLGYTLSNVRWISNRANILKSDASLEEITAIYKDLKTLNAKEIN